MTKPYVYQGKDLEAMSFARNYHNWVLDEFRPYLGHYVVEVGSGTGLFSELLFNEKPERLLLIEPSEMFLVLSQRLSGRHSQPVVKMYNSIFTDVAQTIEGRADTIIYINVLEHIEDDVTELKRVYETLKPGGSCLIFVPALKWLFGRFDKSVGHFRRYSRHELEIKVENAGFKIEKSKFLDFAGILPWYVKYRLMNSDSLGGPSVQIYDKLAVPIVKAFEARVKVPIGKNLLIVGKKLSS